MPLQDEEAAMAAKQASIARIWRGRTRRDKADAYAVYQESEGVALLRQKALGVQMFRQDRPEESEFVVISYWESIEAMSRFAGSDPRKIHHLPRDADFLIALPEGVEVLEIIVNEPA